MMPVLFIGIHLMCIRGSIRQYDASPRGSHGLAALKQKAEGDERKQSQHLSSNTKHDNIQVQVLEQYISSIKNLESFRWRRNISFMHTF
jgi:hypothetical protein